MPTRMAPEEELVFYHSVGRLMDRWGYIDSLVTQLCKHLSDHFGHGLGKRVPWGLSDRLDFVADCLKDDSRLQHLSTDFSGLLDAVRQIDRHRSFIVHGCKTEFFRDPPAVQFTKFDRTPAKDGYEQWSSKIGFSELAELGDGASAVIRALVNFATLLNKG